MITDIIIININMIINIIININIIMNIIILIIIITNRAAALARARSAEPRRPLFAVTGRASRDRGLDCQTRL